MKYSELKSSCKFKALYRKSKQLRNPDFEAIEKILKNMGDVFNEYGDEKLVTLQTIKDLYHIGLTFGTELRGFDDFLKDEYIQSYDDAFNFIGYQKK